MGYRSTAIKIDRFPGADSSATIGAYTMFVLCCASPHSFVHSCHLGKLGSVFRSRRRPLILRFFPGVRVSTFFAEENLHLVISSWSSMRFSRLISVYLIVGSPCSCAGAVRNREGFMEVLYHRFRQKHEGVMLNFVNRGDILRTPEGLSQASFRDCVSSAFPH